MKREIKFRKWHKELEDMTFWDGSKESNNLFWHTLTEYPSIYKLMQLTGLKDINGKDIYEGDIISYTFDSLILKGEIEWNSYCGEWQYKYMGANNHTVTDNLWRLLSNTRFPKNVTVIGNIYENSDLLKV